MATSAFKSTTKRTPIGASKAPPEDSAAFDRKSSHRRSRSLSCFSRGLPERTPAADDYDDNPVPSRGRFVNKVRGSGFPEISLDDLAVELFDSSADRSRSVARSSEATPAGSASQRRGRSVSRHGPRVGGGGGGDVRGDTGNNSAGGRVVSESKGNSSRRRSVSVARYQKSDSESDLDHTHNRSTVKSRNFVTGNNQTPLSRKSTDSNFRPALRRSLSQKDFKSHDGYSSQSSVLTDDEGTDAYSNKNGVEKTIRAVYSEKKAEHPAGNDVKSGLYEVMRKELRHAVEEIRSELEIANEKTKSAVSAPGDLRSNSTDVLQAVSSIRKNYSSKLEQSEKRKQDLLAEIVLEEQHSRELSKIVKELLPEPNNIVAADRSSRTRRRSNDRGRMSKRLTEEAERYIEDFISNVEDTDISSIDGERSDTSSSIGGITKHETYLSPAFATPLPVAMDGVLLPWLLWETSNDATPIGCKNKNEPQGVIKMQDQSNQSVSSHGSWSPGIVDALSINMEDAGSKVGGYRSYECQSRLDGSNGSQFDMEDNNGELVPVVSCYMGGSGEIREEQQQKEVQDINDWLPITKSRNATWWYSAFHNVTAMVGAGVLGLPYAMGPGVAVLVLSWIITLYTLWQMVEMHEIVPGKRFDRYHELGQHAFGEKLGLYIVVPQQLMVEVGTCIVYMITGGNSLKKIHSTVCPDCKPIKTTYFIMIFASVHFVLSHLPSLNSIASVSLAAAVMSLSYSTIAWGASLHKGVESQVQYGPRASTAAGNTFNFFSALGDVAFAFAGHNVVLEIQATIPSTPEKPSKKPMWKGVVLAYIVVALCYLPVALIGYWVFGNHVEDNILISLEKPAWLIVLANCFVVVHVYAMPVFDMAELFLLKKMKFKPSLFLRFITRNVIVAFTLFVGITFPFFGGLLGFFGGFAFAPTTYYLPCIMWLVICKPKRFGLSWFANWFCIIVGVSLMLLAPIGALRNLILQAKDFKFYS
ncbi:unnamed protein product [Malus baccata var. baccata]